MKTIASLLFALLLGHAARAVLPEDPFYNHPVMPAGPLRGQPLDVTKKRAIRILDKGEFGGRFAPEDGGVLIANVYHNKRFYLAQIPEGKVRKLWMLIEPIGGTLTHNGLRYQFERESPVKLVALVPTEDDAEPRKLDKPILLQDLMVSAEVSFTPGTKAFSLTGGLRERYGLVLRVMSLTGRGTSQYLSGKIPVYQIPINYTAKEASRSLSGALELSDDLGMNSMYHLFTKNCNVFVFKVLLRGRAFVNEDQGLCDRAIGRVRAIAEKVLPVARWHPPLARFVLRWRGYADRAPAEYPLLNDDPAFREVVCEQRLLEGGEANE